MKVRLVLRLCFVLFAAAAIATVILVILFPAHWRIATLEQFILTPLLRPAYLGDGKLASELILCYPMGLAINRTGELLISDRGRARRGRVVWRIDSKGFARIVAGNGRRGTAAASSARSLSFDRPEGLAVADNGSIYVSDGFNHAVYRIDADATVTRVAGTGAPGFSGDGGMADQAMLFRPADIRLDSRSNLFIADVRNHRVRKVDTHGRISTVAGTGTPSFSPDGTLAARSHLNTPWGIAIDRQDRLIIGDGANHRVRRVDDDGRLVTIAGSGHQGYDGDGGMATEASLNFPEALAFDSSGRLFIGDEWNHAVRVVDRDGLISTVIGTGGPGKAEIGEPAKGSPVDDPEGVLVAPGGDLIITDGNNGRVLRISDDGIIHHLAGQGDVGRCASRW